MAKSTVTVKIMDMDEVKALVRELERYKLALRDACEDLSDSMRCPIDEAIEHFLGEAYYIMKNKKREQVELRFDPPPIPDNMKVTSFEWEIEGEKEPTTGGIATPEILKSIMEDGRTCEDGVPMPATLHVAFDDAVVVVRDYVKFHPVDIFIKAMKDSGVSDEAIDFEMLERMRETMDKPKV